MKSFHFFLSTPILAAFFALALFSCQKENIDQDSQLPPAVRHVTLTDKTGKNTAVVRLSGADQTLLDQTDWAKILEMEPVFERPNHQEFQEIGEQVEAPTSVAEVDIEIESQQLEPGALGLSIHFRSDAAAVADRWQYLFTYTTSYDNIKVTTNYNCHDVWYYKRVYSNSNFTLMAAYFNRCTAGSWTSAWWIPSYQMQAKVYYNSNTSFTITAW